MTVGIAKAQMKEDNTSYFVHDGRILIYKKARGASRLLDYSYEHIILLTTCIFMLSGILVVNGYNVPITMGITFIAVGALCTVSRTSNLATMVRQGYDLGVSTVYRLGGVDSVGFSINPRYCQVPYAMLNEYTDPATSDKRRGQLKIQMTEYLV